MPDWADEGRSLQHPDRQANVTRGITVRIGLDFGTAFTKVAIRVGEDLVPIVWAPVTSDDSTIGRYVLPGFVVWSEKHGYCWHQHADAKAVGNLKLPIIDAEASDDCPAAAIAYLALVIRYARAYLYRCKQVGRLLKTRGLRWELNIGCPTEPHDNKGVVNRLRRIAQAAWRLAGEGRLPESLVKSAWLSNEPVSGLEADPEVVPEFVAQIAGYLGSPQVREGLHALVDFGAATVDIATFNVVLLTQDVPRPRIPILFSAVRPLGTHFLQLNRHSKLGIDPEWDDAVPVEPADEFAKRHSKDPVIVKKIDSKFEDDVANRIDHVINSTRTNSTGAPALLDRLAQYPRGSVWRDGLPMFITGGGSTCQTYRQAVDRAFKTIKARHQALRAFGYFEIDPQGGRRPRLDKNVTKRLSVAIGLTEDAGTIATIVPHREMQVGEARMSHRVDHTEIYSPK